MRSRVQCDEAGRRAGTSRIVPFFLCAVLSLPALLAQAQPSEKAEPDFVVANGTVNAVVQIGDTIYFGGSFRRVGSPTGSFVSLDKTSGEPEAGFPKVAGTVYAIESDGSGGWFIGGDFLGVSGVSRDRLAHIRSDGTLDMDWNPGADGIVQALVRSGSTLYIGGKFAALGGQARMRLAAVDAATGALLPWDPDATATVHALSASADTLYVGGEFPSAGGQARSRVAAFDLATGNLMGWDPAATGTVEALLVSQNGARVYVGGSFTEIGGQSRNRIAALDPVTGQATAWDPDANNAVYALLEAPGGATLYVGGAFTEIAGSTKRFVTELDTTTGATTGFAPLPVGSVRAMALSDSTMFIGGMFSTVDGEKRTRLAEVELGTGSVTSWDPVAGGTVYAMAASGTRVYAGGYYSLVGGEERDYLAAMDATTGQLTSWNPRGGSTVRTMAVSPDESTIYVGGQFGGLGGVSRNCLGALDVATGDVTGWNPNAGSWVYSVAVSADGNTVYAGGIFTEIGASTRNRIAAIDAATGAATAWDPGADGSVSTLLPYGSMVYAGGDFTTIGGAARNRIAAINATTGLATAWDPDAGALVSDINVSADGTIVYAGGNFLTIGGQTRRSVAALDATTGLATAWAPDAGGSVRAVVPVGSDVYIGGYFSSIAGEYRQKLVSVNASTGALNAWYPSPNGAVLDIFATSTTVAAVGEFSSVGVYAQSGVAFFGPPNTPPDAPCMLGPTSYVDGSTGTETSPALTFVQSDAEVGDGLAYRIQIDDDSDFASPVVDYVSAPLAQGEATFVVGQNAGGGSYAVGAEGQVLAAGAYYWRVRSNDDEDDGPWTLARGGDVAFTIVEPAVGFEATTHTVGENAGAIGLIVNLDFASAEAVAVDYTVASGTAIAWRDFSVSAAGTITFSAGETSKAIVVTIIDDAEDEPDETLIVSLSNPACATLNGASASATVTIRDNDVPTANVNPPSQGVDPGSSLSNASNDDSAGSMEPDRAGSDDTRDDPRGVVPIAPMCGFGVINAVGGIGAVQLVLLGMTAARVRRRRRPGRRA